jgi:hypothetical protein
LKLRRRGAGPRRAANFHAVASEVTMLLWNRQWTRKELMERVGALSQLGGITHYEYADGKSKGVSALRVRTAAGLDFEILPDKGMDIVAARYQGKSLSWHSPVGIVHPAYYDARDIQWVKTFPGGLLTTCGMYTSGFPSKDGGEELGLHGAASNTPAEHVSWDERWEGDECVLTITGEVRETWVHGPNLLLTRTYTASLSGRTIAVRDSVENQGFHDTPLMHLYHMNFGFPLLTDRSLVYAPSATVEARGEHSQASVDRWAQFEPPVMGMQERVYYHEMKPDAQGNVTVVLVSDDGQKDFGVAVRYRAKSFPRFIQWKMTGVNHFVLGLEPANCRVEGRPVEREAGRLKTLRPGEKEDFAVDVQVLDGKQEVADAIKASGH